MTHRKLLACAVSGAIALMASEAAPCADDQTPPAPPPATPPAAAPAAAAPTPPPYPAMSPTLAADANSPTFDLGLLGHKVTISGAVTGLALVQNNPVPGDNDHWFRRQQRPRSSSTRPMAYSSTLSKRASIRFPDLGTPYIRSTTLTQNLYDPVPQAFLKIAPNSTWSFEIGKLPTLIGAEYTFSIENMNIERGLLWNQEPAVSRGVQINYTKGKLALSLSWNDGLYSNRYSWLSASATVTLDSANTLEFAGGGNLKRSDFSNFATPLFVNNEEVYNVIYTHTHGPWVIEPYFQYTYVPALPGFETASASTWGGALFVSYAFDAKSKLAGFSLPVRVEYIDSTGSGPIGGYGQGHGQGFPIMAANLLYGPGSKAWSVTVTPTYQFKIYFIRAEFSYVSASGVTPGFAFGPSGVATSQTRGLVETGVLF